MGRAYSDDLRRKLLEAHGAGKGTLRELAERFGVSVPLGMEGIGRAQAKRGGGACAAEPSWSPKPR